jgi:hypothetical protein
MHAASIIMKIALLSAGLVVVVATSVSAAPVDNESTERVSHNERHPRAASSWTELASPTPASHEREYIAVDGRYTMLRIDASAGRPVVRAVRIRYKDGTERVVRIDRALGSGKTPSAFIELRGLKEIDHLVVTTVRSRATYAVYATAASNAVATR